MSPPVALDAGAVWWRGCSSPLPPPDAWRLVRFFSDGMQVLVLMRCAEEAERISMDKGYGGAQVDGVNVSVRLFQ